MKSQKYVPLVEPWVDAACAQAVGKQVASGLLGPGEATGTFARRLAALTGRAHCILTTSGTIALTVAAKALDLKPGDEIIVPAYGVISTINAFASFGYAPRLVDIDPATACIDPAALASRLTARTKAVCFVNFSGHTGEPLAEVAAFCSAKGLPLIEDAACALGHRHNDKSSGSFGNVGCLSFSVPKIVTTGQGGAVVTDDKAVGDRANAFIDHGDLEWRRTNLNRGIGTNLRFNDVLASLGLAQLDTLGERLARKRKSYRALRDELDGFLYGVPGDEAPLHYIVFSDDPPALVGKLRAQEVGAAIQYRFLADHPPYAALGDGDFLGARTWARSAVYLPFGLAMSEEDARRVGQAVKNSGIPIKRWPG
jgi:perosamine synthetase